MLALLELLQSGGVRTVAELADRLGVDERTVRRYVDHLIDLDVPVESVRGRYGGDRLAAGYRMPPLMLSDDEALAVLLGLVAGRRAGLMTATGAASETAAAKIRRVLPARLARRLDAVLDSLAFTAPPGEAPAPDTGVLLAIASTRTVPLFAPGAARPADNSTVIIEFLVDDVDGVHRNLAGFVEDFVNEPTTMPWGNRSLLFRDPDGNLVNFFTPVTQAAIDKFAR